MGLDFHITAIKYIKDSVCLNHVASRYVNDEPGCFMDTTCVVGIRKPIRIQQILSDQTVSSIHRGHLNCFAKSTDTATDLQGACMRAAISAVKYYRDEQV